MKLNKLIAVPAIALAAGISLAACGSVKAPATARAVTHTVTAPAAAPKPTTPAPTTPAPAPVKTVYVQAPAARAPAVPAPPVEPAYFTSSTAVVQQFYADINDGDYSDAWALGGSIIGGGSYSGWVAGYASTANVSVGTFQAYGSDQVQTTLTAVQNEGPVKYYEGTYTVSGGVIVAANIVQTG